MNSPEVSVIVEGYNETLDTGCLDRTIAALRAQRYPLEGVEILLVGSPAQAAAWAAQYAIAAPFESIRAIPAGTSHYYELKNRGAAEARGGILAFLDSDVTPDPGWLGAIAEGLAAGAEATCGPTTYQPGGGGRPKLGHAVAASISWGFLIGPRQAAHGFLSHNFGIRRDVFERFRYRTDLGRTRAGSFLFESLKQAGVRLTFQPRQLVAHGFFWNWWYARLHVRFGHEVYLLHRMKEHPAARLGPLETLLTPAWHVALDFRNWQRYSAALNYGLGRRLAGWTLVLPLSILARGGEAAGMAMTALAPERMSRFAAHN